MSDVPELDKLLEEHEIYKSNIEWEKRERLFMFGYRFFVWLVAVVVVIGTIGGAVGAVLIPALWAVGEWIVPEPQKRDPFKRYMYK